MITILVAFFYLILISYIIRTIRNVLYHLFLWQLKEYRWDRMLAHLKTSMGKKWILGPFPVVKSVLFLLLLILTPLNTFYIIYGFAIVLFWLIWLFEAIKNVKELLTRGWLKPKFTPKVVLLLIIILVFQFPYLILGEITTSQLSLGILLDRLLGPIVASLIILFNIPLFFFKRLIISLAKKKISQRQDLIIVGITGSFGKTSTKEFLAQILSGKFRVAKTPQSINTEIGIAKFILQELKKDDEVLIVEMGAYKKGEIASICGIVSLDIGIITGINEQHVELFGSLENTMKTKFELIQLLKKGGTGIFNTGNGYVRKMWEWAKEERADLSFITYERQDETKAADIFASDIRVTTDKLLFKLDYQNKKIPCEAKLAGIQNVDNILAAVACSFKLGLSEKDIQAGINDLQAPDKTMRRVGKLRKLLLVDDSFNANPDGVEAALEYMKLFLGIKILVLTPLIELGKEADKIHQVLGQKAGEIADLILLTNLNFCQNFIKGVEEVSIPDKVQIVNSALGTRIIKENSTSKGVVVFEGREAGKILKALVKLD